MRSFDAVKSVEQIIIPDYIVYWAKKGTMTRLSTDNKRDKWRADDRACQPFERELFAVRQDLKHTHAYPLTGITINWSEEK